MRKRNCDKLFDNIMWYLLYLLPIIIFIIVIAKRDVVPAVDGVASSIPLQFGAFMTEFVGGNNPLLESLYEIFTQYFPMINEFALGFLGIIGYCIYFIAVFLIHLFVDFILFIPRLAHKWLNHAYQGD